MKKVYFFAAFSGMIDAFRGILRSTDVACRVSTGTDVACRVSTTTGTDVACRVSTKTRRISMWQMVVILLCGLLCAATITANAQNFAGGSGTEADPFLIATDTQLHQLAELVNADNADYNDKHYRLEEDIDLSAYSSGNGWIRIGSSNSNPFRGNFDGNGKTITGLYINNAVVGLFGYLNGATVKSLNVIDVNITGSSWGVGGIAGDMNNSRIENCHVSGVITGSSARNGGIVGGMNSGSVVTDCYVDVDIAATTGSAGSEIGGIAGWTNGSNNIVQNCYVIGTLSGSNQTGGIIGQLNGSDRVENCVALTRIVRSNGAETGRIIGRIMTTSNVLINNAAFIEMSDGGGTAFSGANTGDGKDGEDFTFEQILEGGALGGRFTAENGWTTEDGKLPGFGTAVNLPTYITDGVYVKVTPHEVTVKKGATLQFTASVSGINNPAQTVTWSVAGGVAGTSISSNGLLSVAANETAELLTVRATSTEDNTYFGSAIVVIFEIEGDGEPDSPYIIETHEQLAMLAKINTGGVFAFLGYKYYRLGANIDLSDYNSGNGWVPIGNNNYPFRGNFDGNGKTITGLRINSTGSYSGLFGNLNNAIVKNLNITGVNITGGWYTGGLAGYIGNDSRIENCRVSGVINSSGGEVGGVIGNISSSMVSDCYVDVEITAASSNIGGIAGYSTGGIVQNCYATGTLSGSNQIGGIVGQASGRVSDCVALTLSIRSAGAETGRIVGRLSISANILINNVAFSEMSYADGTAFSGENTADGKDGEDINIAAISADGTIGGRFTAENGWTTENGKLPGFGAAVDYPAYFTAVTVVSVTISPEGVTLKKGSTQQFTASVGGTNSPAQTVTWSVAGGVAGTSISANGLLTVAANETAILLTVKATSTADNAISASVTVVIFEADGSGEPDAPYIIETPEQLALLAEMVNSGNPLFINKYYRLGADIDLSVYNSGNGWIPIGTMSNRFRGNFDGNGKTITSLFINGTNSNLGLFGNLDNAIVKNLNITGIDITGSNYIGGIAGQMSYSIIENCHVSGVINSSGFTIGGIAGNMGNENVVSNCYVNIEITSASYGIGGIAGNAGFNDIVTNCYVTGALSGSNNIGGIVGQIASNSKVENCAALNVLVRGFGIGRIVGNTSTTYILINNVAFSEMLDDRGSSAAFSGANTADGKDGEDITIADIAADGTIGGRFTAENGWTTQNGKLPGFGAAVDFPAYFSDPTVAIVAVSPMSVVMSKGDTQQFTASVVGINNYAQTVTWSVTGGNAGTLISSDGLLTIADNQPAGLLTVTATSTTDETKFAAATVALFEFDGTGEPDSPYIIETPGQLAALAVAVNSGYGSYNVKHYQLGADIDLSDYNSGNGWIPIGNSQYHFRGYFDGAGKTITGLYINGSSFVGLFGYLNEATVKNLNVIDVNITGSSMGVGGLAGSMQNSRIENCHVAGVISGSSVRIGGIVGSMNGGNLITDCYVNVEIDATGSEIGGIAGWTSGNNDVVQNCYVIGTLRSNNQTGGLVGQLNGSDRVENCAALAMMVRSSGFQTGRIVGFHYQTPIVMVNNVAYSEMTDGGGTAFTGAKTDDGKDGEDITLAQILADGTIGGRFTAENGWVTADGKLPTFSVPADLPDYFNSPEPVVSVTGVSLNKTAISIASGVSEQLIAVVLPENANNKAVTWTSSNPAVATVDDFGNVTGIGAGNATITVTTDDGGFSDECEVTVNSALPTGTVVIEGNVANVTVSIGGITIHLYIQISYLKSDGLDGYILVGSTVTDANGNYSFEELPEGVYVVQAIIDGVASLPSEAINLVDGATTGSVDFTVSADGQVNASKPVISGATSVGELFAAEVNVYPNPFAGTVRITGASSILTMGHAPLLHIINAAGAVVHAQNITNGDETINLEHLPAGVYLFRFENGKNVTTVRVVKE